MQKNKLWKEIFLGLVLLLLWASQPGCGTKESISLEDVQTEQEKEAADDDKDGSDKKSAGKEETKRAPQEEEVSGSEETPVSETLSVYVCGAVHVPGVYELPAGSRLYQAIDAAGGMREDADKSYLNLAMELTDGEKFQVPTQEEVLTGAADAERAETERQALGNGNSLSEGTPAGASGLVNINTADETLLMTLPGIGEAKAKSIIAYRTDKGSFAKVEDIMNIPGIKQAVFEKIKDAICVK